MKTLNAITCLACLSLALAVSSLAGPIPMPPPPPLWRQPITNGVLAWDAVSKQVSVPAGTLETHFVFIFTNISPHTVTILSASASCGCTVPKLPEVTTIKPGADAKIEVVMDVKGKSGTLAKTITISTDYGFKVLCATTLMPLPPK